MISSCATPESLNSCEGLDRRDMGRDPTLVRIIQYLLIHLTLLGFGSIFEIIQKSYM
jgi:phage shock protein PspC (stress-responsive transcriptional regulator)